MGDVNLLQALYEFRNAEDSVITELFFNLIPDNEVDLSLEDFFDGTFSQTLIRCPKISIGALKLLEFINYLPPSFS